MVSLYSRGMVVGVGGEKRWVLKGRNKVFIIVGNYCTLVVFNTKGYLVVYFPEFYRC